MSIAYSIIATHKYKRHYFWRQHVLRLTNRDQHGFFSSKTMAETIKAWLETIKFAGFFLAMRC